MVKQNTLEVASAICLAVAAASVFAHDCPLWLQGWWTDGTRYATALAMLFHQISIGQGLATPVQEPANEATGADPASNPKPVAA